MSEAPAITCAKTCKTALVVVDVQNDFCPGGRLAVREGDQVVPVINSVREHFDVVIFTQDWHPLSHCSFADNYADRTVGDVVEVEGLEQILWPEHCVQDTPGAELHPELKLEPGDVVIHKGTHPNIDSYSGFFDNGNRESTGLHKTLRDLGVEQVYVCGIATDYCVKATALDAKRLGFGVALIADACRGVNVAEGDVEKALEDMKEAGIEVIESSQLPRALQIAG